MKITHYIRQHLSNSSVTINPFKIRVFRKLALVTTLLAAPPVMCAPMLQLPTDFVGTFGVDYPLLDPVYSIEDGNTGTTDYFFEWALSSSDSSGNFVGSFFSPLAGFMPLDTQSFAAALFPTAGSYVLDLSMSTFHQPGGVPGCGPNSQCFDSSLPFSNLITSASMNVQLLAAVPVTPTLWLVGAGLLAVGAAVSGRKSLNGKASLA